MALAFDPHLAAGDGGPLQGYAQAIEQEYGDYHKVARIFALAIGNPAVIRTLTQGATLMLGENSSQVSSLAHLRRPGSFASMASPG